MTRSTRLLLGAVALVAVLAVWLFYRPGADNVAIDLLSEFPNAKLKQPSAEVFEVADVSLGGDSKRAIFAKDQSRITWAVTVPDGAWLKVSIGLKEEAWKTEGDGVYFFISVSDGPKYEEIYQLVVNPFANASDRGWKNVTLDLSPYAGNTVNLMFNTRASPPATPGVAQRNDVRGDMPLWGEPQVVIR
jgi:hypothetical protein